MLRKPNKYFLVSQYCLIYTRMIRTNLSKHRTNLKKVSIKHLKMRGKKNDSGLCLVTLSVSYDPSNLLMFYTLKGDQLDIDAFTLYELLRCRLRSFLFFCCSVENRYKVAGTQRFWRKMKHDWGFILISVHIPSWDTWIHVQLSLCFVQFKCLQLKKNRRLR